MVMFLAGIAATFGFCAVLFLLAAWRAPMLEDEVAVERPRSRRRPV